MFPQCHSKEQSPSGVRPYPLELIDADRRPLGCNPGSTAVARPVAAGSSPLLTLLSSDESGSEQVRSVTQVCCLQSPPTLIAFVDYTTQAVGTHRSSVRTQQQAPWIFGYRNAPLSQPSICHAQWPERLQLVVTENSVDFSLLLYGFLHRLFLL